MKTNFKRIGKQSISIVLAVMMMLSTMLVGMVTSNASGTYTVYFTPDSSWSKVKVNCNIGKSTDNWGNFDATDTGKTINGNKVYKAELVLPEDGVKKMEFNDEASNWNAVINSWTPATEFSGKYYSGNYGSGIWVDPSWDSEQPTTQPQETTAPTPTSNVIYLQNAANWGTPTIHVWTRVNETDTALTSWPGATMIKVADTDNIYYYTINGSIDTSKTYLSIFSNSGNSRIDDVELNGHFGQIYNNETKKWSDYTTKYTVSTSYDTTKGTVTTTPTSLASGETFKVTAKPNDGYVLDTVTVKDASNNEIKPNTDGSYTMPASNVTVFVTFKVNTDAKYSVTYTAPTGDGVVRDNINPKDTALAVGTPVTVTVEVKEGYTASLTVDGVNVTTSTNGNTYTFTFSMPAQDITVAPKVTKAGGNTGTEIPGLYLIYSDSASDSNPSKYTKHTNLYVDSSNQVFAYFTSGNNLNTKSKYYFLISTSYGENSYQNAYNNPTIKRNYAFNDEKYNDVVTTGTQEHYVGNTPYYAGTFIVNAGYQDTVSSVKINLGYYNKNTKIIQESAENTAYAYSYEVIPTSAVEGMVQVFAKDGTIRTGYQKYADMADTVLENGADLTNYTHHNEENIYYESAYAKVGTKLKITTTIDDKYKDTYFVKAFSINGYSYGIIDASQAKKQNGVYTCEYTIPEDFEGKRIEITPIYYYIDDTDTVTFYVEGFDGKVQEMWGNTVAVQAWYANGEEKEQFEKAEFNSLTKNALGGYPGQPLVYEGGKYSMQIPKYLNGNKTLTVKGITLNNYFWDEIHKQNFSNTKDDSEFNCQTYDYDDFYKLSETSDVDNIIFDFRYKTTTDNEPKEDLNSSTYEKSELEPLKDYYGNIVDIFGKILSKEEWTTDYEKKHLTVISDGYAPITGIGDYATEWSVYAPNGTYITTINCSSLINESKVDSAYQEAYKALKAYANLPVKIAYEMSKFAGYHKGTRADGRWYFSKKADTISANIQIQYGADASSEFKDDTFKTNSNEGTVTGAQAYFTNAGYSGKTTCEGTVDGGNFSVHAQTDANAKYYFLGWYLKTSDGYSFITNESDTDIPMTSNATYVARFINTPSGTLTLSHTLLTGSADGKTFIKADIIDSNGKVIKPFEETSGNIVIPSSYVNYASEYKIVATLRTVPCGKDEVEGFYNSDQVRYTHVAAGEKTCVVSTTIKELFEKIDNGDGTTSFKLKKPNIPFYSNITSKPINYQITYTYKTRLNGVQSYVIKDTVSGVELDEMWAENVADGLDNKYQLSKEFITKKAPFVSNYREEIKWNINVETINEYTATVSANTRTDDLNISALKVNGQWTQPATVKYGTLATMSNGEFLYKTGTTDFPAQYDYNGATKYDFSFWAIFDNREKADQYSKEVAAYMSGTPDPDMSKRLTALTKLNGYDNLISKSYSKEYNYISYQDYYIVPVYAGRFAKDEINEAQASIRLLEYTRNQWTTGDGVKGDGSLNEGGSNLDYLYTDFALSFDKNQLLIKDNPNIKVGIALELVAKYKKDFDLKNYVTDSDKKTIGDLVKNATSNGKAGNYEFNSDNRNVYRYEIKNANISVKNRIEYYLRFKNSETSQQNVMKVYSYIYDTQSGEIFLSDPVYMNMYDIGNLTYITSGLASNDLQPATGLE